MTDTLFRTCFVFAFGCLIHPAGGFLELPQPLKTAEQGLFFQVTGHAQGTTYAIQYEHSNEALSKERLDSIFKVIDRSLSIYDTGSLISRFNRSPEGLEADDHLLRMVKISREFYDMSAGVFDITIRPLSTLWGFGPEGKEGTPSAHEIKNVFRYTGMEQIYISGRRIGKKDPRVQIDCNGIAQGYTVDIIADFLVGQGVRNYLVELGGEIRVNGVNREGKPWTIGIESPPNGQGLAEYEHSLRPGTGAVTSSGIYRNRKLAGGKMISHIINPKTGYPISHGMVSVTVCAKDATTADAMDNILMVLGPSAINIFLKDFPSVEACWQFLGADGQRCFDATEGFRRSMKTEADTTPFR